MTQEVDSWDKVYPDTLKGAIAFLAAESTLDLSNATGYPDPEVEGVWMVEHPGQEHEPEAVASIVYLKGYDDPWGNERKENDWETEYDESLYGDSDGSAAGIGEDLWNQFQSRFEPQYHLFIRNMKHGADPILTADSVIQALDLVGELTDAEEQALYDYTETMLQ